MSTRAAWEPPSPGVAALIRTAAELLAEAPDEVFAEVDAATLSGAEPAILADPALVAAIKRTNRLNLLHWARANIVAPGAPVAPDLGPEVLGIARDLVRRGLDWSSLDAYRTGQNVAWRQWMQLAFGMTADPAELAELLDITARSIFTYVDEILAGLKTQIDRERERLTRGTHAERFEVVTLILEGAPISAERASTRLGYALDRPHTAAIVAVDTAAADPGALEQVAEALARAVGQRRPFTVSGSVTSLWVWVPGGETPSADAVAAAAAPFPEVRIALGPTAHGLDGFRRSHLDALATLRLLHRAPGRVRSASFDDVEVVALATQDEERAREFVTRTLGPLSTADADLRETVRVYLREEHNATRAATALFAHRNTVLNRLARAEQLLPAPIGDRGLQVGLALEIVRWLGPAA
ncbi:helix-turn-helix domain-containing protein [Paraconexibacter antarcticus]|uniref:Helix-turn-helix domain-containing protein n=1 Tax=Paraconexibacter antarcticus TaxID=2949664 RepID=A0ABY5DTK4_9ACTN|nr:helix-turn-helix domain-containing protein [Paraconexibacter antarcticus]UTI65360.1 helix-turn-helix domain-containing protein [Paraconexibacter antarcticus]